MDHAARAREIVAYFLDYAEPFLDYAEPTEEDVAFVAQHLRTVEAEALERAAAEIAAKGLKGRRAQPTITFLMHRAAEIRAMKT